MNSIVGRVKIMPKCEIYFFANVYQFLQKNIQKYKSNSLGADFSSPSLSLFSSLHLSLVDQGDAITN